MASFQNTVIHFGILGRICILLIFVQIAAPQQQATTPPTETKTYEYEYDIKSQYHNESKGPDGVVKGEYGHWSPDGWFRITNYTADKNGYRVNRRRLRVRKGPGTGSQTEFPLYSNRPSQGGVSYGPPGSGGTLGTPGVYTPRSPYSPSTSGYGVNGVGGTHGLGVRPGDSQGYGTGLPPGSGSTGSNFGPYTDGGNPALVKGGVPPLGVYPSHGGPAGTLTGREPWSPGPVIVTTRPGSGTGSGQYPISTPTTFRSTGPYNTVYPAFQQATPSQRYKYPPSGPGVQGGYPGFVTGSGGGDDDGYGDGYGYGYGGQSSNPTGPVTNGYGQKSGTNGNNVPHGSGLQSTPGTVGSNLPYGSVLPGTGGNSGPYGGVTTKPRGGTSPLGSELPEPVDTYYGTFKPKNTATSRPYGGVAPGTDGADTRQHQIGLGGGLPSGTGGDNWPYGGAYEVVTTKPSGSNVAGFPGTNDATTNPGGVTSKTSGGTSPFGSGLPGTNDASRVPGGVTPKTSGGTSPFGSGLPGTNDASRVPGGVTSKTSGGTSPFGYGLPGTNDASRVPGGVTSKTSAGASPFGYGLPGQGATFSDRFTPKNTATSRPYGGVAPDTDDANTRQHKSGLGGGLPSGSGGTNWPYGGATPTPLGSGQKPGYPPVRYDFPDGQASDKSCRLEPGHSTIPVGFPDNLKPLGVARDDHSTPDGKMIGKYTLTFPFGYIMEISYSAYQDPALAAKYLPQQTHNPNC